MVARVLVLDDDRLWRNRLKNLLQQHGYEVENADTSERAKSRLVKATFDALVVDVQMAWWDKNDKRGLDMLSEVPESDRPDAVVVTGKADKADVRRAFKELNVVDVLFKIPFNTKEFVDRVGEAVKSTRERRGVTWE